MHKFMGHKKINHGHYNNANAGMLESFLLRYNYTRGEKWKKLINVGFSNSKNGSNYEDFC